ncbi:MAG: triose-phosphate isomerase [Burkholderiales bacterium]|nr:triose-phosphate isomerase [Burkholderiales bacterium]
MRPKLVAGNWKMNGSLAANRSLVEAVRAGFPAAAGCEVAVCVPAPYLQQVGGLVQGSAIALGAQTLSEHAAGAYTGETSAGMLADLGCRYVIVGHSERRTLFGETSAQVAAKFVAADGAGLVPIVCVGETWPEREAGTTEAVIASQLDAVFAAASASRLGLAVIAYEPVWAIGTGKTATPQQAQAVHAFIRARVAARDAAAAAAVRILYGGSVNAGNASALFACPDIDGGLVGGASLKAADFVAICMAASGRELT